MVTKEQVEAFLNSDEDGTWEPLTPRRTLEEIQHDMLPPKGSKKTFEVNDLVWRVRLFEQVTFTRRSHRPATSEDLRMAPEDFSEQKKWLVAGVYVVKRPHVSRRKRSHAVLRKVYDGTKNYVDPDASSDEWVSRSELFPVVWDERHILHMAKVVRHSYHGYEHEECYATYLKNFNVQVGVVKEFLLRRFQYPEAKPLEFMEHHEFRREEYLAQWNEDLRKKLQARNELLDRKRKLEEEEEEKKNREASEEAKKKKLFEEEKDREKKEASGDDCDDGDDGDDGDLCPGIVLKLIASEPVLQFLKTEKVSAHLRRVMRGEMPPDQGLVDRHRLVTSTQRLVGFNYYHVIATGRVVDESDGFPEKAEKFLEKIFDKYRAELRMCSRRVKADCPMFRYNYVQGCLLPEAVIYYLMEHEKEDDGSKGRKGERRKERGSWQA